MAQIFPTDFEEKLTMAQDDYILFSDSEDGNKIKKAQYKNLKWEKWDTWATWPQWPQGIQWSQGEQGIQWPQGIQWETWPQWETGATWPTWPQWPTWATWNWISTITSSKVWKTTTVTITETDWTVDTFTVQDWADGQGAWDVLWPASSTDGNVALFDGTTWKLLKDSGSSLGTAASKNTWTSSWNVPVLDASWKLDTTVLPWVALTDTFTVANKADLTSLSSAQQWDIGIVTAESKTYVLSADPYSTAANWKELLTPTDTVTSVNSQTWAVTLDADDISDATTTNKFVTATDKSTWSGKQDALTLPTTPTQWHLVTRWANNKSLTDWWAVPTVPTNVSSFVNDAGYLTSETVVSGDSGTTYTIKVANSNPWSWTPATTITFVTA